MKKVKKTTRYLGMLLCVCMIFLNFSHINVFAVAGNSIFNIDGYFDDWANIPYSYHINYNDQGWPLPNDPQNKHTISLHRDENNVYLYVKIKELYYTGFNGNNFQFHIDGVKVAVTITPPNGYDWQLNSLGAGRHPLWVRYEQGWERITTAEGYLYCNEQHIGDTAEFKIPLKAFSDKTKHIDPNNIQTIEFFTPNLMHKKVSCTGTSTAAYLGIGVSAFAAFGGYLFYKNKRKKKS